MTVKLRMLKQTEIRLLAIEEAAERTINGVQNGCKKKKKMV